jgi:hypothetical protein
MSGERLSGAEEIFVRWLAEHRAASEDAIETEHPDVRRWIAENPKPAR